MNGEEYHSLYPNDLDAMKKTRRSVLIAIALSTIFSISCHRAANSTTKRYPFTGRVVSIDSQNQSALIDGDDIPGFMLAMAMTYKIKPADALKQLAPGDSISAEVVVVQPKGSDEEPSDYWLENIKVTGHTNPAPAKPAAMQRIPESGDQVPDFVLTNHDGKRISFKQYRGKVLLVTFIYTRCPFPDFCPRMSSNFAAIYKQMETDRSFGDRTRLLSVSFDPEHDSPKVLRDYAFSVAHTKDSALFRRWEFAVPSNKDLAKVADFFGVLYKPDNGLITHNLSTTVLGPDGKIVKWYHGGDWQVSDLIKDATQAIGHNS
jgi:protein SCO1/2